MAWVLPVVGRDASFTFISASSQVALPERHVRECFRGACLEIAPFRTKTVKADAVAPVLGETRKRASWS